MDLDRQFVKMRNNHSLKGTCSVMSDQSLFYFSTNITVFQIIMLSICIESGKGLSSTNIIDDATELFSVDVAN